MTFENRESYPFHDPLEERIKCISKALERLGNAVEQTTQSISPVVQASFEPTSYQNPSQGLRDIAGLSEIAASYAYANPLGGE